MFLPLRLAAAFLLIGAVFDACGQTTSSTRQDDRPRRQPFTAEFKITSVQTLANGTTITRESTEILARDGAGRDVHETDYTVPSIGGPGKTVSVHDPVGHRRLTWDSVSKHGRVVQEPMQDHPHGCWATDYGGYSIYGPSQRKLASKAKSSAKGDENAPLEHDRPQLEDLGKVMIQGVEAHGRRVTTTIPVGKIGNDQTIISVEETWMASSLSLDVRWIKNDPRTGKQTKELVNLVLDEPDPALFRPPDGYEVKTETMYEVPCRE
jgi:hypothetical protein